MVAARSELQNLTDFQAIDNKAHMIWTVLHCHAIVEQFVELDFKGHTKMVQQMTLYMMMERVDPDQMQKSETAVADAQAAVKDALKKMSAVTDLVASHKSEIANLKRDFNNLKTDVGELKKRPRAS